MHIVAATASSGLISHTSISATACRSRAQTVEEKSNNVASPYGSHTHHLLVNVWRNTNGMAIFQPYISIAKMQTKLCYYCAIQIYYAAQVAWSLLHRGQTDISINCTCQRILYSSISIQIAFSFLPNGLHPSFIHWRDQLAIVSCFFSLFITVADIFLFFSVLQRRGHSVMWLSGYVLIVPRCRASSMNIHITLGKNIMYACIPYR